jgi:hypothetical protein
MFVNVCKSMCTLTWVGSEFFRALDGTPLDIVPNSTRAVVLGLPFFFMLTLVAAHVDMLLVGWMEGGNLVNSCDVSLNTLKCLN